MKRYGTFALVMPVLLMTFLLAVPEARADDRDDYLRYQRKAARHRAEAREELYEGDLDDYYEEMAKAEKYERKARRARRARREYASRLRHRRHYRHRSDGPDFGIGLRFDDWGFNFRLGKDYDRHYYDRHYYRPRRRSRARVYIR